MDSTTVDALLDSFHEVRLAPMADKMLNYQQCKAVEAQRALYEFRAYTDVEAQAELIKVVDAALAKVNQLVGQAMSNRLVVKNPGQRLQEELDFQREREASAGPGL
jgi:hypothetical protein